MMEGAEIDLGDYMDVVTTYQCKFCSHTCQTVKDMAKHVQQDHLSTTPEKEAPPITKIVGTGEEMENVMIPQVDQLDTQEKAPPDRILSEIDSENIDVKLDTAETVVQSIENLKTANPTEDENFVHESSHKLTFDIDGKIVELSLANGNLENLDQPIIMKSDEQGLEVLDSAGSFITSDTGTSTEGSQPITKELFLCGQCNTGFTCMEECQGHMYKEHNVTLDDGKVSVGTQVETSRRRSRRQKQNDSEDVKATDLNDSDVEWTIESETEYISKGSRTRSKICPPKALKNDYYLGKTRTSDASKSESTANARQSKRVTNYKNKCRKPGCSAKFLTSEALEMHLKCHTDKPNVFTCPECKQRQTRWRLLRMHLWKVHQIDTDLLVCDQCHYKTDTISRLKIHQEIHSKDKPYSCGVCGKHFRQLAQMRNHQVLHSNDKSDGKGEQECDICNRKFVSKKCLQVHIQVVHGNHKPFSCTVCEYTTARKAQLELHMRTHTQEKPFKCDVCNYASTDHNSLRRHKMRHTGQKPYKCPHCPYSCIQAICFKTHMKNKHFGAHGIFCCELCTYKSVNEKKYLDHVRDHKNGLIPTTSIVKKKSENVTFAPRIQNINQSIPHIEIISAGEQTPVGVVGGSVENPGNQIQMHVEMSDSGERTIREEDLQRLMREGFVTSDITQLISCAMNAITQENSIPGADGQVPSAPNSGRSTTHMITFHLPPSHANTVQQQEQNIITMDALSSGKEEKKEAAVYFADNQGVLLNTSDIQLQQEGDASSVLLNIQGTTVPVNLIQIAANEAEVTQSATIQDLAQISCLVKDSVYNNTTMYNNIE